MNRRDLPSYFHRDAFTMGSTQASRTAATRRAGRRLEQRRHRGAGAVPARQGREVHPAAHRHHPAAGALRPQHRPARQRRLERRRPRPTSASAAPAGRRSCSATPTARRPRSRSARSATSASPATGTATAPPRSASGAPRTRVFTLRNADGTARTVTARGARRPAGHRRLERRRDHRPRGLDPVHRHLHAAHPDPGRCRDHLDRPARHLRGPARLRRLGRQRHHRPRRLVAVDRDLPAAADPGRGAVATVTPTRMGLRRN